MSDTPVMRLWVRTKNIDTYPELYESYKETLRAGFIDKFGVDADWDTFRRWDADDEPMALPEQKGWTMLSVAGW